MESEETRFSVCERRLFERAAVAHAVLSLPLHLGERHDMNQSKRT